MPVLSLNHENYLENLKSDFLQDVARSFDETVPGFFEVMPQDYFAATSKTDTLSHLRAILSTRDIRPNQEILLQSSEGNKYTFVTARNYPGQLSEIVRRLPREKPLHSAQIFTAKDGSMIVDVFEMGELPRAVPNGDLAARALAALSSAPDTALDPADFVALCSERYLQRTSAADLKRHYSTIALLWGSDDVRVESRLTGDDLQITVYGGNVGRRRLFERVSTYFGKLGIDIRGASLESFRQNSSSAVSLLIWQVRLNAPLSGTGVRKIEEELARLAFVDDAAIELFLKFDLSLARAELLVALSHLAHQSLSKRSALLYTRQRIIDVACGHFSLACDILEAFEARFAVGQRAYPLDNSGFEARLKDVEHEEERDILSELMRLVRATLKTNYFLNSRYALGLRLEGDALPAPQTPFAAIFVHGRGFDGIHLRFRSIARGGLRIVLPSSSEQYVVESERLFDECYGLAYAQQLKNKDIPEGGSKGVVLVSPGEDTMRCGKAFANTLLELLIPCAAIKDLINAEEVVYLGPDENVSTGLIEWIVNRAKELGYRMPEAFMSSKPGSGINHKQYGVTSEGLIVFLKRALLESGIDPAKGSFSIKITGGPDGDVAGNAIRILHREFGERCRILAIADASGTLEDVDGLNHNELLRLVQQSLPVTAFNRGRLGTKGLLTPITAPGGLQARASMHNRIATDAFLPAGGRPNTINAKNWREFILPSGLPASWIVVEGANLFLSEEARESLSKMGVLIVKDSSANKCGVICSSYEVIASMLLDEKEFLELKDEYVEQVLRKLRHLAEMEAAALFRQARLHPEISLPGLSAQLSAAINRACDALAGELAAMKKAEVFPRKVINQHIPPVLHSFAEGRWESRVPEEYSFRVIAASLASRIVYREGPEFLASLNPSSLFRVALGYLKAEEEVDKLVRGLEESDLDAKERISHLLLAAGPRALLAQQEN